MGELQKGIEEYIATPGQSGTEQEKIDKYCEDAQKIIHESPEWQSAQSEAHLLNAINNYHPEKLYSEEETNQHFEKMRPEKKEAVNDKNFLRIALGRSIFQYAMKLISESKSERKGVHDDFRRAEGIASVVVFKKLLQGAGLIYLMKDPHMWSMYEHHSGTDPIILQKMKERREQGKQLYPFDEALGDDYSLPNIVNAEYAGSIVQGSYDREAKKVIFEPKPDEMVEMYTQAKDISLKIAVEIEKELN